MKIKHLLATLFAGLTSLALSPHSAQAQTPLTYSAADVFLSFRATGAPGSTQCYLVNLGQVSKFTTASSPFTVTNLGDIGADLTAVFGSNWHDRDDVFWSVSGAVGNFTAVGSDPIKTLYGSKEQPAAGTPSDGWVRGNATSQGGVTTKMSAMGNAFAPPPPGVTHLSTANSTVGYIENDDDSNSYASYMPGGTAANSGPAPGTSFAFFNPTIEGTFTNGTAGSVLDFVRLTPGSGSGTIIGTFSIDDNGALTYTPGTGLPSTANVHFSSANYSVSEIDATGKVTIGLVRDGNTSSAASFNFNAFSSGANTAVAGTDYTAQTNVAVSFAANETNKNVTVDIAHIIGYQGNRTFSVSLTNPDATTAITSPGTATVTILEDEAAPTGTIAFSAANVSANALSGAGSPNIVALTLTRTNGTTGATSVDVTATGGNLVNGTDYTLASPTTVNFADGANSAMLNVPLQSIVNALPGTIVLTLSNPTNGATLGAQTTTTLTIVSPGVLAFGAATLSFAPVDNHANPNLLTVTLNRASGANGAVSADVSVTGGTLVNGTDYDTVANPTTVNFADGADSATFSIQLKAIAAAKLPGTIILSLGNATGGANLGAQATVTLKIAKRDVTKPTVTVTSPVAGANVPTPFTLTGKALDAVGIDRVEVVVNGGSVQLATLGAFAAGKLTYTLPGILPENGKNTLVITSVDSSGNRSLPLNLAVNYLNQRPAFAGSYNGLLVPAIVPASNKLSGLFKLTVTATGNFTGSLALSGVTVPFTGVFGNDGTAHFKPKLGTTFALVLPPTVPASLGLGTIAFSIATDATLGAVVTGTLNSDPATVAGTLSAAHAAFSATAPVDPRYTLPNKKLYTVVFPSTPQGALPTTSFPQGDGWANLTLTPAGAITLMGKLADGTVISASSHLDATYHWPFFKALYGNKGSLAGSVGFDDSQADTDLSGTLLWLRPVTTGKYYAAGWSTGLQLPLHGAKYVKTAGVSILPNLGAADPVNGNATVTFSDGKLTGSLTKTLNVAINDAVTNAPTTDKSFTLKITRANLPANPQITGTFLHTDNTKPALSGVVFQKGANAGAYGFFLSTVPKTAGATGESGGFTLQAK